jgi:hypothetical protein
MLNAETLQSLNTETWQENRPPDEVRIKEVKNEIESSKRVQGIIALACENKKMICYDGNHRRLALLGIKNIKDINVLVSVIWDANQLSIYNEYMLLNKSISVPLIYMRKPNKPIKTNDPTNIISEYVKTLVSNYPKFSSPSKACRPPNFNRDLLTDDLLSLYKEHKKKIKLELLTDILDNMNECYKSEKYGFKHANLKKQVLDKCLNGSLWLFSEGRNINRLYFDKILCDL